MDRTSSRKPNKHPDYDRQPAAIKQLVTEREWCWMGREQRQNLQEELTNPEVTDEGGV